ncbi:hypothetical protein D3C83_28920 [compost metagenome]
MVSPQSIASSEMLSFRRSFIFSRDESAWSSSISPVIERSVVCTRLRIASAKSTMP